MGNSGVHLDAPQYMHVYLKLKRTREAAEGVLIESIILCAVTLSYTRASLCHTLLASLDAGSKLFVPSIPLRSTTGDGVGVSGSCSVLGNALDRLLPRLGGSATKVLSSPSSGGHTNFSGACGGSANDGWPYALP